MKNALIGLFGFIIILLAGFAINTSEGKTMRKNELSTTLSSSMEKSMEILTITKDYSIKDQEEFAADFIQNAMVKMNAESKFDVKIYNIDVSKGILDVEVTETYKQFLKPGTVSVRRTIVLDDYTNIHDEYFTVSFNDATGIIKQVNMYGGSTLNKGILPTEYSDQTFRCDETGTFHKGDDFNNVSVIRNLTFNLANPTYTVHYDGNHGIGSMQDETFDANIEKQVSENKFVNEGHTFKGWASYVLKNGKKYYRYSEDGKSGGSFYPSKPQNMQKVIYDPNVALHDAAGGFNEVYLEAVWSK